jgi:acetylornithine deacetylase/succinyl-diaminopimelate desuccinylase family protein
MDVCKDVGKAVEARKREMTRLLGKLIAADTTNPPGNERKAAKVVEKFFRKNSIRYRVFEKGKKRTNIIGYIGKGKPRLIVACHLDVVPAGSGWKSDPFRMKVRGGKAYGRGANDDKGPLASVLIAGKILKSLENRLKGQVVLACVADEERGSKYGMYYLLEKGKLEGEYAIVPDIAHSMRKIDVAEKGLLHLKITSLGKQAHGSSPEKGVNAVWNMVEFLNLLKKYRMRFRRHPLLSGPTSNLGVIRGGHASNIVPGECEVHLEFRYLPSQKREDITKGIKSMFREVKEKNRKARFRLEVVDDQKPVEVDSDNILVRKIRKHAKEVIGNYPGITGLSGTTVVKPLVRKRILAVGYSPGVEVAHMANEFMSISELVAFAKILCLVSLDLLG